MTLVGVVVPTKNSERTLANCLKSIRAQSVPCSIHVVDNFSTDATVAIANEFGASVSLCGPERSTQRNAGLSQVTSRFVLFIDSDMILERNVGEACIGAYEKTGNAIAIPEFSFGEGFWSKCKQLERSMYDRNVIMSAARFFPVALFEKIAPYDENLYAGEDWDLSIRAEREIGLSFANARILHDEGPLSPIVLWRKKYYYGVSLVDFLRKHRGAAVKRLNPVRAALVTHLPQFMKQPGIFFGMLFLKFGEGLFGATGIVMGALTNRRAV